MFFYLNSILLFTDFSPSYASGICTSDENVDVVSHSKLVQACQEKNDVSTHTKRPDITIEDIQDSDEKIMFYTGLPSFLIFNSLFLTLIEFGADKLCSAKPNTFKNDTGKKRKLRSVDEFLLVMMRLRLGLLVKDLEYRFKISGSSVSKIFNSWIVFMYKYLQSLVYLPKLEVLQKSIPSCFTHFRDTRIILDCTEIFIQTPSSLENKSVTYSNYKSHNTFKVLVGVSMTGATVFVSKLWGGSASDVQITRESSLLQMLEKGDAVMVDKGFIHLKSDLKKLGVKLYCPPFKTKSQFSKEEVDLTRRIASARIHVERKMEQIKNFRILQGVLPLAINKVSNEIFFVCSALTNLMPPLVK